MDAKERAALQRQVRNLAETIRREKREFDYHAGKAASIQANLLVLEKALGEFQRALKE